MNSIETIAPSVVLNLFATSADSLCVLNALGRLALCVVVRLKKPTIIRCTAPVVKTSCNQERNHMKLRLFSLFVLLSVATLAQSASERKHLEQRTRLNQTTISQQAIVIGEWYEIGQIPMYAVGGTWSSRLYLVSGYDDCEFRVDFKDNRNTTRQSVTFRPKDYSYSWNESSFRYDVPNFSGQQTTTGIVRIYGRAVTSTCTYPGSSLDVAELIITQRVNGKRTDLSMNMKDYDYLSTYPTIITDNQEFGNGVGYSYGVALTNNTDSARAIMYTLYDYSTGKEVQSGTIGTLAANEHTIFVLEDKIPAMRNRLLRVQLEFEPYKSYAVTYLFLKFNSDGSFTLVNPY